MIGTDEIAARLTKARADRTAIGSLSADLRRSSTSPRLTRCSGVLRREAGPLAGWKLGVTSRAKQAQVGVHEPVRGFLAAADALDLGSPLVVAEHIQPRCEPEIVFVMGADLSGPAVTSSAVLAATAAVAVGIEVLDSRYTDYKFTMPDVVADNTSAGRYVVGSAVPGGGPGPAADLVSFWSTTARWWRPHRARRRWATRPPRWPGWSGRWPWRTRACGPATSCCPAG